MSEDELREYYNIFTECWRLFKKYSNLVNDEAYWEEVVNQVEEFRRKYPGEFPKELAYALVHELERRSRKDHEENN